MPFGAIAGVLGAGASLIGGLSSADAADAASKRQADTAQKGIDFQRQVLQQIQQYLQPYLEGGNQSLAQLQDLTRGGAGTGVFQDPRQGLGPSPIAAQSPYSPITGGFGADPNTQMLSGAFGPTPTSVYKPFYGKNPNDLTIADYHASPGYASATQGGLEAIRNSASRTGGAVSGNALKALTGFGTQAANQDFQDWRNNYGNNYWNSAQTYGNQFGNLASQYGNNFSNLASIYGNEQDRASGDYYKQVGINSGQSADLFQRLYQLMAQGQAAATGTAGPAINAGSNIANSLAGLGTAQASGILGSNNALQGGISSGLTSLLSGNALTGGGSGSGGGIASLLANLLPTGGMNAGQTNPFTSGYYGGVGDYGGGGATY